MRITPGRTITSKRNIDGSAKGYEMSVTIDNKNAAVTGSWTALTTGLDGFTGENFIYTTAEVSGTKKVRWTPNFINSGYYSVYVNLPDGTPSRDAECPYTIKHADGTYISLCDQRTRFKRKYLGTFRFDAGEGQYVEIDNKRNSTTTLISADAMIFVQVDDAEQPDMELSVTPLSNTINRIDITEDSQSILWIERISNGKSFGIELIAGTKVYYDYFAAYAETDQITYRVGVLGKAGYAAEATVKRLNQVTVTADIQVSAIGFKPGQLKEVMVKPAAEATKFSVIDALSGGVVQGMRDLETTSDPMMTSVMRGDFSTVSTPGYYRIKTDNGLLSTIFPIGDGIYDDFLVASIRSLKMSRWPAKKIVTREDTKLPIDIGGGWEDAIDYKHWTSYNDTIQPFALMELIETGADAPGAEEELRYGLSYLLKIQERNPNGSGVMKFGQLAAAYSDIVSSDSEPYILRVENIDLDDLGGYNKRCEHVIAHYLYSLVLSKAAGYFKNDPEYALQLKTQAIDAYAYMDKYDELPRVKNAEYFTTRDYFRALPVINYAYKALASYELYKLTGTESYKAKAKDNLSKLVQAQRRDHKKTSTKVTGLFSRDIGNAEIMRSRIHAGIPLYALSFLAREIKDATESDWMSWHNTAKTFVDGFIKRFVPKTPYKVIPYGFGIGSRKLDAADTMNYRFFQGTESESAAGYSDGNTKMLALYAGALYEYSVTFGDKEAARIADRQMEWLGGKNVFGTPTIAGIGEVKLDSTKLTSHGYAANSYDLVGTMVNGIDGGQASDYPTWTNAWQMGETWGVNRAWMQFAIAKMFKMGQAKKPIVAYYIDSVKLSSESIAAGAVGTATVKIVNASSTLNTVKVKVIADNATLTKQEYVVNVHAFGSTDIEVPFTAGTADKTMVIAAIPDGDRTAARSVLGFVQ